VYVPGQGHHPPQNVPGLTAAAQIAAQYDPSRNNQHPQRPPQQPNHAVQEPQLSVRITLQTIKYVYYYIPSNQTEFVYVHLLYIHKK